MGWLPVTVLCHVLLLHGVCADFGLPNGVPDSWMVEFNAVQLRDALNEVAGSLQRIPAVLYSERVQESAKIITELMNNVSALGRNVSESFVNATRENTAPVEEVFAALQKSSDTLKSFLESNSSKFVAELGLQVGNSFTRTYYALLNRDESDVYTIKQTFQTLRYKMSDLLRSTSQQLFSDIQTTTESLASMILTRSAASERCTPLLSPRILGTFGPMHGDLVNCINRERGRLSRITDSVDKVMQLLQVTAADFSSDIGSCSRFGAFATDRAEFVRAKGCLETNVQEMYRYDQVINSILTLLQPSVEKEADASRFRLHLCVTQRTDELRSLMEDTRQAVGTCVDTVAADLSKSADLHLEAVSKAKLLTTNAQAASLKTLLTVIDAENTAAINKYKTAVKTIQTDLVGAVKRLDVFSRNVTLLALKESTSEAFTTAYYELNNRNQMDLTTINDGFHQLRSNVKDLLQTTSDRYFSDVQSTAESLASVTRARGTFSEKCNAAIGPKITGSFAPLQREVDACLARERLRLSRISDSVDRAVQLLRLNMADFATDISSCTRFALFATNSAD
ncbi:conserved hypothetical protein [Culex quinquefasciatus]|uniref:Uncharacterized protein n=1 Tax=Culex quinquefasciatus TaxID=7176 RepID=B0WD31_CULQU|nr:conserved hypothetical protein [Culex quinquefasciatus]|eukprot:XP_001846615.1 conserved hypothetical protein [Culex quinquefasciatus]